MANIINKYPYTDFHELNLDYILSQINANNDKVESLASDLDTVANTYVKKVEIVNGSVLKVYKGNGSVNTYALPSGNNFVVDLYDVDEETVSINDLEVSASETYNTNLTDYSIFADSIYAGIPSLMRYIPGGPDSIIVGVANIQANWAPTFIIWDTDNSAWKVFNISVGTNCKATVTRVY